MSVKVGEKSPEFLLPATLKNEIKMSNYIGKNVILYFYPKDNTPG